MKNLMLFTLMMVFTLSTVTAQVSETTRSMSMGDQTAFSTLLKKVNKKEAEKAWAKYLKDYKGKTKINKKTAESFTDNAVIKDMSTNTVDVYASLVERGEDVELYTWFDLGGAFLSSKTHPDKVGVAKKIVEDFTLSVSIASVEDLLKTEEVTLKKLSGDLKKLTSEKTDLEADIEKYLQKIEDAKTRIGENGKEQVVKEKEITVQQQQVEKVKMKLSSLNKD